MEILKLIKDNNLENYSSVKKFFNSEPYNLKVCENKNLYLLQKNKSTIESLSEVCFNCNGLILEKDTNKIVCYGTDCLRYIEDFNKLKSISDISFEKYYDGTLIKVYYYDNKWNYSTNGYIDAFQSYWLSKKSFGELFKECINLNFENKLDKKNCYTFILIHPDNRHIVNNTEKKIIHISTRNLETLKEIEHEIEINKPEKFDIDIETVEKNINTMNYSTPGYIVSDGKYKYILTNAEFNKVKKIRGNNNNIDKICIENILKTDKTILKYYPEFINSYEINKVKVDELVKTLFILYRERHMYKNFKTLPPRIHYIINNIHKSYKKNNINITKDQIFKILTNYLDETYYLVSQKN